MFCPHSQLGKRVTTLRSCRIGGRAARVTLLSETAHLERVWLGEAILSTAHSLGADTWDTDHKPEVTVSINDKEHSTHDYRRLQLPSGCELLMITIHLPHREDEGPEIERYAVMMVRRLIREDHSLSWEIPEDAHLVMLVSTEDESLEPFVGRSDLEQLQLLGLR